MSIEDRLRALEDQQSIVRRLYAYGHAIDYGIESLWLDCFSEDALLHWQGHEPCRGHAEIAPALGALVLPTGKTTKHLTVQPIIRVDGSRAVVNSYYARLAFDVGAADDRPEVASFGRYEDVLARAEDGAWRLSTRIAKNETHVGGGMTSSYDLAALG